MAEKKLAEELVKQAEAEGTLKKTTGKDRQWAIDMVAAKRKKRLAALGQTAEELLPKEITVNPERMRVWERRLLKPFDSTPTPIPLREPGWVLRWINSQWQGRLFKALHKLGWEPVKREELGASIDQLGVTVTPDGVVSRGDRHQEILCKLPESIYRQIQAEKARHRIEEAMKPMGVDTLTQRIAGQFGQAAGDEAARAFKGGVTTVRGPEDFGAPDAPLPSPVSGQLYGE